VAADLLLGWWLMAIIIFAVEGSLKKALPWIVAIFCIGNLVTGMYVISRLRRLHALIRSKGASAMSEAINP
jgi:hypothetical protein